MGEGEEAGNKAAGAMTREYGLRQLRIALIACSSPTPVHNLAALTILSLTHKSGCWCVHACSSGADMLGTPGLL